MTRLRGNQLKFIVLNIIAVIVIVLPLTLDYVIAAPVLYVHDSSGNLGTVDVATGSATVSGNMGVVMTDIAFDPVGTLYGLSFTKLYTIDPVTTSVSFIGSHGISGGNALVFAPDGTLYGAGDNSSYLYSINSLTGVGTSIGNIGYRSAGDHAFLGGNFYMSSTSDTLINIDLSAGGTGSSVGSFGFSNVYGLATGDDGILYGVSGKQIFSVNTSTGAGTLVSNYSGQGLGTAYGSSFISESTPPVVPEPISTVLFLTGGAVMGARRFMKKK